MKKSSTSSSVYESIIDSSSQEKQYKKETTITEKATTPVILPADSISFSRWFSILDTTGFVQVIDSDGMTLETTVKHRLKDGKPAGYDVSSKAKKKPQQVNIPVDRTITTREQASEVNQMAKKEIKTEKVSTSSKHAFRLNGWGALVLIGISLVVLFFLYKQLSLWMRRKL